MAVAVIKATSVSHQLHACNVVFYDAYSVKPQIIYPEYVNIQYNMQETVNTLAGLQESGLCFSMVAVSEYSKFGIWRVSKTIPSSLRDISCYSIIASIVHRSQVEETMA